VVSILTTKIILKIATNNEHYIICFVLISTKKSDYKLINWLVYNIVRKQFIARYELNV